ncbi:MAG: Eco57I restriction-modification methylase domain-containing protein, partial [Porphyromonas endodontalis]
NYITSQEFSSSNLWGYKKKQDLYDYVIGNPPYRKISKDSEEALNMCDVCYGAPNLYFLFWAMGIHNLKEGQELVYIVPRSWTSGLYFKKFRQYLFTRCVITDIHLFESREQVFKRENVLQETVIVKLKKSLQKPFFINITTTATSGFDDIKCLSVPYSTIVDEALFVYLITNEQELVTLNTIKSLPSTLSEINHKMQTGLIVDFRTKEVIRDRFEDNSFPLLYPQHIKEGKVVWPLGKQGEVIKTNKSSLLQKNGDYLMIKRFTTKEEARRLQCGVFLKQNYPQFEYISTQNKINFIRCESSCIMFGLYVLFNSSLYDNYYRILNGSTQVNATEVNQMPIPSKTTIEAIGREVMTQELSVTNCDKILKKWII